MPRARRVADLEEHPNRSYPPELRARLGALRRRRLGEAFGLTQFGANLTTIPSGGQSALRHWHSHEDELVYVLAGEVVLVSDGGEEVLRAGDVVGFRGGDRDAHHLQNRSSAPAQVIEIGARVADDVARYPDDDLMWASDAQGKKHAAHKDGTPY